MMTMTPAWRRRLKITLAILVVLGAALSAFVWYKFFRREPQVFANEVERFKYGSIGAEDDRGLPYYIWLVLPRIFPDKLPGSGGYKSFGLVWEENKEVPVGFSKMTIGFPRVANNCAICHCATYRTKEDEVPRLAPAGPAHTTDIQGMIRFLTAAAKDPRFNADTIMAEITQLNDNGYNNGGLTWIDKQIYRYLLIPITRQRLREQEKQFEWMERPGKPHWGKGRDDPMNLTKYFMTSMPEDKTVGQADFPSIWNLGVRKGTNLLLNWSGDTPAVRSVLIDSALGLGARPNDWFLKRMEDLDNFLSSYGWPSWPYTNGPYALKPDLIARGKPVYDQHCSECHDVGKPRTSKVIPIEEIGTDRERLDSWNQAAADEANRRVKQMGINRPNMVKNHGYISPPLDGLWLRAPYLHHGSVPNLRELLEPVEKRSKVFQRGYDLYDPVNVGFVATGPEAERLGFKLDTTGRGNGNQGHTYGVNLSPDDKNALLEYLKTL